VKCENELSNKILTYRSRGKLTKAIELCYDGINRFPEDYFYYKILGDICYQIKDYETAINSFVKFLIKIHNKQVFSGFSIRYDRVIKSAPKAVVTRFVRMIKDEISKENIDATIISGLLDLLNRTTKNQITKLSEEANEVKDMISDDNNFNKAVSLLKKIERENHHELEHILDSYVLNRDTRERTMNIDKYCIAIYERMGLYAQALKIAEEIVHIKRDGLLIRTLLRICRKLGNYQVADRIISDYPEIIKGDDFNILYELVYYYNEHGDKVQVESILRRIEKSYINSIPISKTLKNFYLQFGMINDAKRIENHINKLFSEGFKPNNKYSDEVQETEEGIWLRIKELYDELEHQKQLSAISELTTGISHELGQPITNIRYTIQYYDKVLRKKFDQELVFDVFNSILDETERMGGLIKRLAPLTSSKSINEDFNVLQRIKNRVKAENAKFSEVNINVKIQADENVIIYWDPIKFDQIMSNLIVNSIYAIKEKETIEENYIIIKVEDLKETVKITFEDSGTGVSPRNRRKIFEPFYSTKPPGEGEGLGLFIIWNLLKMQGGGISLDTSYTNGARFILEIPKRRIENGK
jgi:signal transduction histidine kinase